MKKASKNLICGRKRAAKFLRNQANNVRAWRNESFFVFRHHQEEKLGYAAESGEQGFILCGNIIIEASNHYTYF
ncbi:MAG: hypothetical protein IJ142_00070 [Bacteroidaceae bacterium]|nr:hypothetical protein [Bacteroidaceae bacterium]